jgi:hypothetical protein
MPGRSAARRLCLAAVAVAAALLGPGAAGALAASGPTTLAYGPVDRMVQSTGNLYWTSHGSNELGDSAAAVYRASKSTTPGAERALYVERRSVPFSFGDLTYASAGDWYAYFVANYPATGVSQIKRIPLAGGPAVPLVTSPAFVGLRDIDNDGAFLYWADAGGLRKMPVAGGLVTTLASDPNITSVGLDATRVVYSSGSQVFSIPKTGGASKLHFVGWSKITAMDVDVVAWGTFVYVGEENGAVTSARIQSYGANTVLTHQNPIAGRSVRSVSYDGSRVLWTDCANPGGGSCAVRKRQGSTTTVVSSGGVGVDNVQGDAGAMFWSDPLPKRYVH